VIRVVLTVVLAAALLGAALPGVDCARVAHTDTRLRGELDSRRLHAEELAAREHPVPPAERRARRVLTLRLPGRSWGDARATVTLGLPAPDADGSRFAWRVGDGRRRSLRVDVPVRVPHSATEGRRLRLSRPGRHRLVLAFRHGPDRPVVTVRRLGFKYRNGTTPGHARLARRARPVRSG
jgi:hypothetical protein